MLPTQFVELGRRFAQLDKSIEAEEEASSSYATYFDLLGRFDGSLSWKEILEFRVVVVLGEPGSGKTWELRQRAHQLSLESKYAFYIRLDELAGSQLEHCLDDKAQFTKWKRSSERAHFFLDSVDEAKLRNHSDFETALRKFLRTLNSRELVRASFVISSRISDWQSSLDESRLACLYPLGDPKLDERELETSGFRSKIDAPKYFKLRPLDARQIRLLIESSSKIDVDDFMRSLDEANAWEFARRPSDVMSLSQYWNKRGSFGALFDLVSFDISEKLKESDERRRYDSLTPARARAGAQTLAAASILCKQYSFQVPNGPESSNKDVLDAILSLPEEWKPGECSALLNRALFDGESYGRIRIYHRRVAEYLCAEWLGSCMERGCGTRELQSILLCTRGETSVIRASLVPVAAWLGCGTKSWNDEVRSWILRMKPTVLLEYGDPGSLPADYQLKILNAIVDRYGEYGEIWVRTDSEILARFADSSVSTRIGQILLDPDCGEGVKKLMLRIVRFARIGNTIESVISLFGRKSSSVTTQLYCLIAVRDLGTQKQKEKLFEVLQSLEEVSIRLVGLACQTLYPTIMTPKGLSLLIQKASERSVKAVRTELRLMPIFESIESADYNVELLAELNKLLQAAPHISTVSTEIPISDEYLWCGVLLEPNLRSALRINNLSERESWIVAESVMIYEELTSFVDLHLNADEEFSELLNLNTSVRRSYVWLTEGVLREGKCASSYSRRFSLWRGVFRLRVQDRDWLIEDLVEREVLSEKQVALNLLMEISDRPFDSYVVKKAIGRCKSHRQSLLEEYKKVRRVQVRRHYWRIRYFWRVQTGRRISQGVQEFRRRLKQWSERNADFLFHAPSIASGERIGFLYESIAEQLDAADQWSRLDWKLILIRSPFLGRVVRRGCKKAWRRFVPRLPHERRECNRIELVTIVGLSGITASVEDGELDFELACEDTVQRLVRYALNELNGVPAWFEYLAESRPQTTMTIIQECIEEDWSSEDYGVLHRLLYHCEGFVPTVSEVVLQLLVQRDPGSHHLLIDALILLSRCEMREELCQIAASRVSHSDIEQGKSTIWMCVLMELDAGQGMRLLRGFQNSLQPEDFETFFTALCNGLTRDISDPYPRFSNPSYMQPTCLRDLIPMVFETIHIPDDLVREPGAYFPTARDGAQRFRNDILARLAENVSLEAHSALVYLREHPSLELMRDYLAHLIERQMEAGGDADSWDETDIRNFEFAYEKIPKTAEGLFTIALRRLDDIRISVEESDRSLRGAVRRGDDERCLRIFLARQLAERSRGAYDPPEEVEIDLEQRPDIRVVRPGMSPISVEVKLAENWSYNQLRSGLKNQLVAQYLKRNDSRHGVYVIGYIDRGKRKHWRKSEEGDLDFSQLIEDLDSYAKEIGRSDESVDGLEVIGIDFQVPER